MSETPFIKLEGVWKEYLLGEVKLTVLKNINLSVKEGSFLSILGQSGSGKSTLLHIIGALDVPTRGKVFFGEKDLSALSDDELAEIRGKKIGFVFQQFNLLSSLTALENVMLPSVFQGMEERERVELAEKALAEVGLAKRANHRPGELSGGEQQRVAIARALINDPEVIVADEPTGNTDSKTGAHIMEILSELNKKHGKTVILVTHEESFASYADKIVRIKDGEIQ